MRSDEAKRLAVETAQRRHELVTGIQAAAPRARTKHDELLEKLQQLEELSVRAEVLRNGIMLLRDRLIDDDRRRFKRPAHALKQCKGQHRWGFGDKANLTREERRVKNERPRGARGRFTKKLDDVPGITE